jgi:hypothetical protein
MLSTLILSLDASSTPRGFPAPTVLKSSPVTCTNFSVLPMLPHSATSLSSPSPNLISLFCFSVFAFSPLSSLRPLGLLLSVSALIFLFLFLGNANLPIGFFAVARRTDLRLHFFPKIAMLVSVALHIFFYELEDLFCFLRPHCPATPDWSFCSHCFFVGAARRSQTISTQSLPPVTSPISLASSFPPHANAWNRSAPNCSKRPARNSPSSPSVRSTIARSKTTPSISSNISALERKKTTPASCCCSRPTIASTASKSATVSNPSLMTLARAMPAAPWFPFSAKTITAPQWKSLRGSSQNISPTTKASRSPAIRPHAAS